MAVTKTISVVIPVFNEAENVPVLVRRLKGVAESLSRAGYAFEVVFVDDHSVDGTNLLIREIAESDTTFRYIRLSRNCGSYTALAAGLRFCGGDCAVCMAADLQDPPEFISNLVARWDEGFEVVWATRGERIGESCITKGCARIFYWLMRRLVSDQVPSKGADFVLVDRKVIDAYNAIPEKHTSFLAMILWMGFRQCSIEYSKQARNAGNSKWTVSKKLKLFVDSIISFSYAPIRLMSCMGLAMAFGGFIYAITVLVSRLVGWVDAGTGFAALMTVLLVGQGCILMMLGVLGEYLWRTFDEARGRPRYLIEECLPPRKNGGRSLGGARSMMDSSDAAGTEGEPVEFEPRSGCEGECHEHDHSF